MKHGLWARAVCIVTMLVFASFAMAAREDHAKDLPPLPRLEPITLKEPDSVSQNELDVILQQITSADARSRENAKHALESVHAAWLSPIVLRIQEIRETLDREKASRILEDSRRKKKEKKDGSKSSKDTAKPDDSGDWLEFLLQKSNPSNDTWRSLVKLVVMEHMLTTIGTTPAVRQLVAMYSYFGDLLRIDLQRQLGKLGDKAIAGLIEGRKHDAEKVQKWVNRLLDQMGRTIPSEAIATKDTQALADILRAYGRTRDVDALRVILGFINSDRPLLRDASREAVSAIGEPGLWQLRDAYQNLTGEKAPREYTWDRITRELFYAYDHAQLTEVIAQFEKADSDANNGKITSAISEFDSILARFPSFPRRKEMAKHYEQYAKQIESENLDRAFECIQKSIYLDPNSSDIAKRQAESFYIEGLRFEKRGIIDKSFFSKTLSLDPQHAGAQKALVRLEDKSVAQETTHRRLYIAGSIFLGALFILIAIWRWGYLIFGSASLQQRNPSS